MKGYKTILMAVLCSFSITLAKAQVEYNHALGITALFPANQAGWGFTYDPRLNFAKIGDNGVLSFGSHITAGISLSTSNPDGNSLVFDLPLVFEYNSGFGSTRDNDATFGWFGGIGYDVTSTVADANGTNTANGIIIDGGIRFGGKLPLSVRVSYLLSSSTGPNSSSVFGLGVSYMFGLNK